MQGRIEQKLDVISARLHVLTVPTSHSSLERELAADCADLSGDSLERKLQSKNKTPNSVAGKSGLVSALSAGRDEQVVLDI